MRKCAEFHAFCSKCTIETPFYCTIVNTVGQNGSFVLVRKTDNCDKTYVTFYYNLQCLPIFCMVVQIATSGHN